MTSQSRQAGLLLILLVLGFIAWATLHRPDRPATGDWAYLGSLSSTMVLQAQTDGRQISPQAWADILALRSTLPQGSDPLISQLKRGKKFDELDWAKVPKEMSERVAYRRALLLKYRVYQPATYAFPVAGEHWYEDTFGAGREGGKRKHEGTDIFGREGTTIISVCSGEVEQTGWNRLGGERVGVRGEDGNYYYYAHLQVISSQLVKGNKIAKGEIIGRMGHTGDALTTPDHLHFGIEIPGGLWINPFPFLQVWEREGFENFPFLP